MLNEVLEICMKNDIDYPINCASVAPTRKPVNQSFVQIIWLVFI